MKKIIITVSLCAGMLSAALAQGADPTQTKRGIPLLPQAGDIALGIDANPFLKYLGGFMGGNSINDTIAKFKGYDFGQTIYAKYFLTDKSAVRAKVGFNFCQDKQKTAIQNDYTVTMDPTNVAASVFDTKITNQNSALIELGYELRRGRGRVQGFYGGEVHLELGKEKIKYNYGNPITESNQTPTNGGLFAAPKVGHRTLTENKGTYFGIGVGGFVGVEYFFAPCISIGGELGLRFGYYNKGQDTFKSEEFIGGQVVEHEWRSRDNGKDTHKGLWGYDGNGKDRADLSDFHIGLHTRTAGNIFVMFHF